MKPGSHAFAAAIVDMPARRSSFTSRSCNVPNARSTRPFACGLLAQMMSMFSSDSTRPNCVMPIAAHRVLGVHPENAVLVAVKRHWLAVRLQIGAGRAEVIERRFRRNEPQLHQPARRVVDECQQRARRRRGPRTRRVPSRRSAPVRPDTHAAGAADAGRPGGDGDRSTARPRSSNHATSRARSCSRAASASFSAANVGPKSAYRSRTSDSASARTSAGSR